MIMSEVQFYQIIAILRQGLNDDLQVHAEPAYIKCFQMGLTEISVRDVQIVKRHKYAPVLFHPSCKESYLKLMIGDRPLVLQKGYMRVG